MNREIARLKAEKIKAHREHCVELVRQGKMTVDDYIRQACGWMGDIPQSVRAAALAQIASA